MATRIPTDVMLVLDSIHKLRAIETAIRSEGFALVRARLINGSVRIEVAPVQYRHACGKESVLAEIVQNSGFEFSGIMQYGGLL